VLELGGRQVFLGTGGMAVHKKSFAVLLSSVLAVAGLFAATAAAQELTGKGLKPVATIAFSGTGELIDDLNFVGGLSGNPQLGAALEMSLKLLTGGQELTTLDKSKPWGAVLLTDGQQFRVQGFLPLGDIDQLRQVLEPLDVSIEERGEGRLVVPIEGQQLHLRAHKGWVFVGNVAEALDRLPDDPVALLEGLHESYNLAVRVHVQNIPELFREYFMGALQMGIQAGAAPASGDGEQAAARNKIAQKAFQQVKDTVADLDSIQLGLNLDEKTASLTLDYSITALAGTQTATRLASGRNLASRFTGFAVPNAALSFNAVGRIDDGTVEQLLATVESFHENVLLELKDEDLSADEQQAARQIIDGVAEVAVATLKQRDLDGGILVILDEKQATWLAGMRLANTDKLEEVARTVAAEIAKLRPDLAGAVKFNADQHASIRFHTLTVPVAALNNEMAAKLFGDELNVVLGIGDAAAYLCAGSNAAETLKKAIDSENKSAKALPPLSLLISAGPIASFLARNADDETVRTQAATIAQALAGAEGKDRITLKTTTIDNGQQVRIEVEQGLLKLLGILPVLLGPGTPPAGN
jgi:hypothetical protein